MSKKLSLSTQAGWSLLRLALQTNHLQEQKDNQITEKQAESQLDKRHQLEMAQISLFLNPQGWTKAIMRYRTQQVASLGLYKAQRGSMVLRQQQESADLEQWIAQQQEHATDIASFDQLQALFSWSLTAHQQQTYHQALSQGHTVIITDSTQLILWTSQSFVNLTGYEPRDVVGHRPQLLQGPATDRTMLSHVREHLRSSQAVEVDLLNYYKGGSPYLCHMRIEPLYGRQGALTHFSAIEYNVK